MGITAAALAASEKALEQFLAKDAEEVQKSLGESAETEQPTLADVLKQMKELEKSIAGSRAAAGPGDEGEGEGEEKEGEEGEDDLDENAMTFVGKSLGQVESEAEESGNETALELSRWLDGCATIIRDTRERTKSLGKSLNSRLDRLEERINLLVSFQGAQARKALAAEETAAAKPAGRAGKISVLETPVGRSNAAPDPNEIPDPRTLNQLAQKALKAGTLTAVQVSEVETYINGVPGEFGPTIPPPHLLQALLAQRNAA